MKNKLASRLGLLLSVQAFCWSGVLFGVCAVWSWAFAAQGSESYVFVKNWGRLGSGDGEFALPYGVALDSSGNVYVADSGNHRIQKFTREGVFLKKWGSYGSGDGGFDAPCGVAVDSSGNVYVADFGNHCIQKFTSEGAFLKKWGTAGSGDGDLHKPLGVAADSSGNVYVADSWNSRIQKFTSEGVLLKKWGTRGSGDGQFDWPSGVAVDSSGSVYIADSLNNRIQKFTSDGVFLKEWGSWGSGDGQFDYPWGVAVDPADRGGNVYVADTWNRRIQKFTSEGLFLTKWGSWGTGDGQFDEAHCVAVDSSGNVYVTDDNNQRIQRFRPTQAVAPDLHSVVAYQAENGLVEIYYALAGGEGETYKVSVVASDDGGVSWNLAPLTIFGDLGSVVSPGTGKHIVWDVARDVPGSYNDEFRVRVSASTTAGATTWIKNFGSQDSEVGYGGSSVRQASDGGYIVAGGISSPGSDVYLLKTDFQGNEEWSKTFGGAAWDWARSVQQTADGGYIVVGETGSFGDEEEDVYLIKTDSQGNEEWSKTFGGEAGEEGDSVQQTSDGGYIVAGDTDSFGAGRYDVYLIKTDSQGNEEWSKTFGGEFDDWGCSVHQTSNGGYIVAGFTESFGNEMNAYLLKTDSEGNEEWSKTFGGDASVVAWSVQETADGGYVAAGDSNGDVYLLRTDSQGNEQWSKTFGGDAWDYAWSVQQTTDGGYIAAGFTESFGPDGDVYLLKTDSQGNEQWSKTFGGDAWDYGWSVQQTTDGGYIVVGDTRSFRDEWDVYLIKTDPAGNVASNGDVLSDTAESDTFSVDTIHMLLTTLVEPSVHDCFLCGREMLLSAKASYQAQFTSAVFSARLHLGDSAPLIIQRFYDDGTHGDSVAGDKLYSTTVTVPLVASGEYQLTVSAKAVVDGNFVSGSATVPITIEELPEGAASVTTTVSSVNYPNIFVGETATFHAAVTYPGAISPEGTQVTATIVRPDLSTKMVVLQKVSEGAYETAYTFSDVGRYIVDTKATPPASLSFAPGYHELVLDVNRGRLTVVSLTGAGPYKLFEAVPLNVSVTFEGEPVQGATLMAEITGPVSLNTGSFSFSDGVYQAAFSPRTAGEYSVQFFAQAPGFLPGAATSSFQASSERSAIAEAILSFASAAESCFTRIIMEARSCAEDGDFFAREQTKDQAELCMDLVFGLTGIVTTASKSAAEALDATKDAIKLKFPGWGDMITLKHDSEPFIRMFQDEVRATLAGEVTEREAAAFFKDLAEPMLVYLVATLTDKTAEEVVKEGTKNHVADILLNNTLTDQYFDFYAPKIAGFSYDVRTAAEEKARTMPVLSPQEEDYYIAELSLRKQANDFLSRRTETNGAVLHAARQEKQRQNADLLAWLADFGLHCAPSIVALLVPGVGLLYVGAEACLTLWDAYQNSEKITGDVRWNHLASFLLKEAGDDALTIYFNTLFGILRIEEGSTRTLPDAHIESVADFCAGFASDYFGWVDQKVWSQVTVRNDGEQSSFRLYSKYMSGGMWRIAESPRTLDGEVRCLVDLAKDETRIIGIKFQDDTHAARPDKGWPVFYYLMACRDHDQCLVHTYRDEEFDPFCIPTALRAAPLNQEQPPIVLDEVVRSQVVRDQNSLGFDIRIRLGSPFPCPISAKVSQVLPEGLEVVEATDGVIQERSVSWACAVQPHASEELTLRVDRKLAPDQQILINGARVEVFDPSSRETLVFAARDITLAPVMPLRVEVSCPVDLVPAHESNMLCVARNLLSSEVTADLIVEVATRSGEETVSQSYPLSLQTGQKANFILPLTLDIAPGTYVLSVSLTRGTIKESLYSGWLTVLADEDGDGMPTSWENLYGLNPLEDDAAQDKDKDGLTNYEEYVAQTNPTDDESFSHRPSISRSSETANWEINWSGAPARIYEVEWTEDDFTWHKANGTTAVQVGRGQLSRFIDDGVTTAGDSAYAPGSPSVRRRFYRVRVYVR